MLDVPVDSCIYAISSEAVSEGEDLVILCLGAVGIG
jgi:hypothetical protein